MKKKKIYNVGGILIATFVALLIVLFCTLHAAAQQKQHYRVRCERCVELEYAIKQLLIVIEEDQTDYVLDVLSETDEWDYVDRLLNEDCMIPDSTYRKLRKVFPDLPAKQAPQWK